MKHIKITLFSIFVSAMFLLSRCGDNNPLEFDPGDPVAQIISETNLDLLTLSVKELSGEVSVNINSRLYTISSRHRDSPGNNLAADYIEQKLESYGLEVVNESFSGTGRNVYAIQEGTHYPEQKYIICAHYDSYPAKAPAPGADDNASGTAAVLEAARILSNYTSAYSIMYALWDEEELGLLGSRFYATNAKLFNENVMGVINIDMIGWDSNDDDSVLVVTADIANSNQLSSRVIETNNRYQIGLAPKTIEMGRSDHVTFWQNGFGAITIIEYHGNDFNNYYHSAEDKIEYFNLNYFFKCTKLAIGALAALVETNGERHAF